MADTTDIVAWLYRASTAIYIAVEQSVADDISEKMRAAAAEIQSLRDECSARVADARIKAANAALVPAGYVLVPVEPTAPPTNCTCHPDDEPPVPCPRRHALTDCRVAAFLRALRLMLELPDALSKSQILDARDRAIHALTARENPAAPQPMPQAERHLTPAESAAMDRALRRSVTVVARSEESKDG